MLDVLKIVATAAAAFCWLKSALVALTPIAPGQDELDKVTVLAGDLQTMGKWNCGAAASACVAAALELVDWMIGLV
jgi:hypothetical protein